jgi:ribulose-phosphate 3-epimerase
MKKIKIAPSILSANFAILKEQIATIEKGGADWIHLDVMDGHFVPNITFGPVVVKSIRSCTKLPLDAHLMIESPDRYLENFREVGVDRLTVHVEACQHLHRTIQKIKELGMKAGVSVNPATNVSTITEILPYVDQILVMTVNPGFGGQKFIESTLKKIEKISSMIAQSGKNIEVEVDGGVDTKNASQLVEAGATVLVAGYSIFSQKNISKAVNLLRTAALRP